MGYDLPIATIGWGGDGSGAFFLAFPAMKVRPACVEPNTSYEVQTGPAGRMHFFYASCRGRTQYVAAYSALAGTHLH